MSKASGRSLSRYAQGFKARQAARMAAPAWLRWTILISHSSCLLITSAAIATVLWSLHRVLHPGIPLSAISDLTGNLMFLPTVFGAICPSLLLSYFFLHCIPPVRKALDEAYEGVPGTAYAENMRVGLKMTMVAFPITMVPALVGAIEPWTF